MTKAPVTIVKATRGVYHIYRAGTPGMIGSIFNGGAGHRGRFVVYEIARDNHHQAHTLPEAKAIARRIFAA